MPHNLPPSTRVVIVGNGYKLSQVMQGMLIDQYDVVVRVGDFKIRGFELHVGTKTTFWTLADADRASPDAPKDAVDMWEDSHFAHLDYRKFPPRSPHSFELLPENIEPTYTFKSLLACIYRWPKNLVSITGHGPGCYWTKESGESDEVYKAEQAAIANLMNNGLVWNRLGHSLC